MRRKCGWFARKIGSKYQKKHIVAKDVVGLLLGEVVSAKKKHIVAMDVVGLQVGDMYKLPWSESLSLNIEEIFVRAFVPWDHCGNVNSVYYLNF